jgi:hypothetical protein
MARKEFLEQFDSTLLAVFCGQVANEPSVAEATVEKAMELKREWVALQSPPSSDYKEEKHREEKRADLKARMAEFLATT